MKTLAQSFNTAAQDSNPGSRSRESKAPPVSHCALHTYMVLKSIIYTYTFFHFQTSLTNSSRPRSCRVCLCSCHSFRSTTTWVAMPAWSVPGFHRTVTPRIRCLKDIKCWLFRTIALCRDPSTRHLDGYRRIWTVRNMGGQGQKWRKNVFQNHRYC